MKKISSAILAAVALAAFGFVSCDHDYSNSDIQAGTPSEVKQAEIDAANKGGSDEGEEEEETFTSWTADLSAISTALASYKDTSSPAKLTIDPATTVGTACVVFSPSQRIRVRDDGSLNYNGGTADAFSVTTVGGTLAETLDRYVGVDTSKLAKSGNVKVTISVKAVSSSSATADSGVVVLVDGNNKILAVKDSVAVKSGNQTFDIDATVAAGTAVYCGFSRGGAGGGGIDVTALTAEAAE